MPRILTSPGLLPGLLLGLLAACSPPSRAVPTASQGAVSAPAASTSTTSTRASAPPTDSALTTRGSASSSATTAASAPGGGAAASASAAASSRFPPPLPPSAPGAPDLAQLRARLAPFAARRFDHAAQERGCPDNQTLGEYLALLVRSGMPDPAAPSELHRLSGSCLNTLHPGQQGLLFPPVDLPEDAAHWSCRIEAFASDAAGESPWRYELRLRVRRADGAIDITHLSCPGMP